MQKCRNKILLILVKLRMNGNAFDFMDKAHEKIAQARTKQTSFS